jgi:hypothetical protein
VASASPGIGGKTPVGVERDKYTDQRGGGNLLSALAKDKRLSKYQRAALRRVGNIIHRHGEAALFESGFAIAALDMMYCGDIMMRKQEEGLEEGRPRSKDGFYRALRAMRETHKHMLEIDQMRASRAQEVLDISVMVERAAELEQSPEGLWSDANAGEPPEGYKKYRHDQLDKMIYKERDNGTS